MDNDERRDVAANIRSAAERAKDDLNDDSNYSKLAVLYVVFCGVRGTPHYKDLLHLADLIEPAPERTCLMLDNGVEFCCSECDWRHDYDDKPRFCAGCGAKVVEVVDE